MVWYKSLEKSSAILLLILTNIKYFWLRQWATKEDVELDTLSEWINSIGDVVKRRIRRLKNSVNTRSESIFCCPGVIHERSRLQENFVIVSADKASNSYTFACKKSERGTWTPFISGNLIWQIFLYKTGWTITNRSSIPSEYRQMIRRSICSKFIGFRRCTKIHVNIDSLRVRRSDIPLLYPF